MKEINLEIMKRTKLKTKRAVEVYYTFMGSVSLDSKIDYLQLESYLGRKKFNYWLSKFISLGLIRYGRSKHISFKWVGYKFMDDEKFYIYYRNKGEKVWTGRIERGYFEGKKEEMLKHGYEFKGII